MTRSNLTPPNPGFGALICAVAVLLGTEAPIEAAEVEPIPYVSWLRESFPDSELVPEQFLRIWAADSDPDGDGAPNLFEYAARTNPLDAASSSSAAIEIRRGTDGGGSGVLIVVQFERRDDDPDLTHHLEYSEDLAVWSVAELAEESSEPIANGVDRVRSIIWVEDVGPRIFARLRLERASRWMGDPLDLDDPLLGGLDLDSDLIGALAEFDLGSSARQFDTPADRFIALESGGGEGSPEVLALTLRLERHPARIAEVVALGGLAACRPPNSVRNPLRVTPPTY